MGSCPFFYSAFTTQSFALTADGGFERPVPHYNYCAKKGSRPLWTGLAHKDLPEDSTTLFPNLMVSFFCDSVCFDTNSIDWFSELSSQPTFALFLFVGESDSEQLSGTMQTVLSQSYPLSEIFILTSSTSHPKTVQQANLLVKKHSRIRKMHCLPKRFWAGFGRDQE